MTVWFTSDFHLFDDTVAKQRGFDGAYAMNDYFYKLYFDTVEPGDTVFFLGDFGWNSINAMEADQILTQMCDQRYVVFITGNHDPRSALRTHTNHLAYFTPLDYQKFGPITITMCHFPLMAWDNSGRDPLSWHLYGHFHKDTNRYWGGKKWNVAPDANGMQFVSLDDLKMIMHSREIEVFEHVGI